MTCGLVFAGCGTDAVGVAECRAFESVRCQAAVACGFPDVEECDRFHRDHCLHGVGLESISAIELDACAQDIGRAGRCAETQGSTTAANACSEPVPTSSPRTACDVVLTPEFASSCAFLVPVSRAEPRPRRDLIARDAGS